MNRYFGFICTYFLLILIAASCKTEPIYLNGKYSIYKKKLMSYYAASPDLFVKTDSGTAKINLNPFSGNHIPQEKIEMIEITEVGNDSVNICFTAQKAPESLTVKDSFGVNIKYCLDSILSKKN